MAGGGSGVGSGNVVVAGGVYLWPFGLGIIVPNQPLEISASPRRQSVAPDKDGTIPRDLAVRSILLNACSYLLFSYSAH